MTHQAYELPAPCLENDVVDSNEAQPEVNWHVVDALANSATSFILTCGGDGRIEVQDNGRNIYGASSTPAPKEIWFSSSTACAPSEAGFAAARYRLSELMDSIDEMDSQLVVWFNDLRARLLRLFGIPGAEVVLSASGTETAFLALALAQSMFDRPLTNIVIAPNETASGLVYAGAGRHFNTCAAYQPKVEKNVLLEGWQPDEITLETIEIREPDGTLREAHSFAADLKSCVRKAVEAGRAVIVHVLSPSKIGQNIPNRQLLREIVKDAAGHALIVVDACQLRCSREQIAADLEAGYAVALTGSKFAGGPAFCGALLLPAAHIARLQRIRLPRGLQDYSARLDWPQALAAHIHTDAKLHASNIGMGLRWEAALCEMEAYYRTDAKLRACVIRAFGDCVRSNVASTPGLQLWPAPVQTDDAVRPQDGPTIFTIITGEGQADQAQAIYQRLREPLVAAIGAGEEESALLARICHVGQPVRIGAEKHGLRISASMPMVNAVCAHVAAGSSFDEVFAGIANDIRVVFQKWRRVMQDDQIVYSSPSVPLHVAS